jgi:hypothetical protein
MLPAEPSEGCDDKIVAASIDRPKWLAVLFDRHDAFRFFRVVLR